MNRFVNPYAFAPLTEPPRRLAPPGHTGSLPDDAVAGRRLSGAIKVTWTLQTPLLLPECASREKWLTDDGQVCVPGSSLKGAVRSLHEALFNGCLRVVDEDFVPSYRSPATTEEGWQLAMVLGEHEGRWTFQLCSVEDFAHIDAVSLARRWPAKGLPTTGDVAKLSGPIDWTSLDRWEFNQVKSAQVITRAEEAGDAALTDGEIDGWVFVVTDIGARHPTRLNGSSGRCLWAASRLTDTTATLDPTTETGRAALLDFERAVAGSEDHRILELADRKSAMSGEPHPDAGWKERRSLVDVIWHGRPVGRRVRHTGFLHPRDVVWVRVDDEDNVTGIKLSQIWRRTGRGRVGDRLAGVEPCLTRAEHEGRMCPSCATFGAADTVGTTPGRGRQTSYAGHVRFSSALSTTSVDLTPISLAPMATPRPGNGMFYLELPSRVPGNRPRDDVPTHWGGSADPQGRARIRGRKFYWHSDPDAQAREWTRGHQRSTIPRYEATPKQNSGAMSRPALLVPAGTTFEATVAVDGLPEAHALALLLALDPKRLATFTSRNPDRIAVHLGGGKPFGLGSATVDVTPHLTPTSGRYLGHAEPVSMPTDIDTTDLEPLDTLCGGGMRAGLRAVLRLLDLDGVGEPEQRHLVTYPPGAPWSEFGSDAFRAGHVFFTEANGQQPRSGPRPWHPLPHVRDGADQTLPVELKRGRR